MAKKGKYEKARTSAAKRAVNKGSVRTAKKGTGVAVGAAAAALVLGLFVGCYAFGSKLKNSDTIFPNVRVAGVDVGGLTAIAAKGEVENAVKEAYASQTLQVQLPDKTLFFEPEQTNVALDVDAAIKKAVDYGKQGGAFRALLNYLTSSGKGYDLELETALELDTEYIEAMIATAEKDARREARNDKLELSKDGQTITVTKGQPGQFLDADGLYEAVYRAFQTANFSPLEWEYQTTPYVQADLSQFQAEQQEVRDAYYDEETKTIVEGTAGCSFDLKAAQAQIDAASYGEQIMIRMEEVQPVLTAEELEEQMFGTRLELRSSPYVNNANRTENLRLACEAINGTALMPGETMMVLEMNRETFREDVEYTSVKAENLAYFQYEPSLHEDKLQIQPLDGGFNIRNVSDEDITGKIVIYFKSYSDGRYVGGITYSGTIQNGMKAGEIRQIMSENFTADGTRVVLINIV